MGAVDCLVHMGLDSVRISLRGGKPEHAALRQSVPAHQGDRICKLARLRTHWKAFEQKGLVA